MNNNLSSIKNIVELQLNTRVNNISHIGKGASGSVYRVEVIDAPYVLALKTSEYADSLRREKEMLDYLRERIAFKVPETYFIRREGTTAYLAMEFISGVSGKDEFKLNFIPRKKHLADNIVDCFIDIRSVYGNKFGEFDNPRYDTWKNYYSNFFAGIYAFTKEKYICKEVSDTVMTAVQLINDRFDVIFDTVQGPPCLSHGDFWMPNMIVDFKNSEIAAILDPFNMIYAEPEYELFSLTLGFGKKLKLYDNYKKRLKTSKLCDLKVELYALCNELHWCTLLGMVNKDYIEMRSKNLLKEAEKLNII